MTALSDALTAAQRSALAALEKAYVAGALESEAMVAALESCGWRCPPCPDEETRTDFLMQHAYEAGILTERQASRV